MGSSQSVPRVRVRLQAQTKPFLGTDNGVVAETVTSLHVSRGPFESTLQVFNTRTNKFMFQFNSHALSEKPSGRVLMSVKRSMLSSVERVYDGDQTETESFLIEHKRHDSAPSVVFAEFYDRLTGDSCRVILEGNSYDGAVLVYLERGQGKLRPMNKHDDRTSSRFEAIARFVQAISGRFSRRVDFLEIAAGVDLTLMLLLWQVHYEIECRRPRKRRRGEECGGLVRAIELEQVMIKLISGHIPSHVVEL